MFTATPSTETGAAVPLWIRTVTRIAGPAMFPGPVPDPWISSIRGSVALTPSPTCAVPSRETAGSAAGRSAGFDDGLGCAVLLAGAGDEAGAEVADAVVAAARAAGLAPSSPVRTNTR